MVAAKTGNSEALGELLRQFEGFLLMRAHRYMDDRLRRRVDPGDLVQRTFLEAQRDLKSFRGNTPAEFGGWLKQILQHNLATAVAEHINTQKRSVHREIFPRPWKENDQSGPWLTSCPDRQSTPSSGAIRAESITELMQKLNSLPEMQAEAIRLRYLEGMKLPEIVERLGKSDTAVAGLLKRGLQNLRSIMRNDSSP